MMNRSSRKGFTLVELLLFAGIISIMAGTLVGFSLVSNNIAVHNEVVSEVEQNGDLVMQRILRTAKESGRIAYPLSGQSGPELLLTSSGATKKEILFYLHGARIVVVENGVASFLSTGDVSMDALSFLHYGTPETAEGVSVVFRATNTAVSNEVRARQYTKVFRGTVTFPPGGCTTNADCPSSPFSICCEGLCRPNCNSCTSHSDCSGTQVCCVAAGGATCTEATACLGSQCDDVADCPFTRPTCNLTTCNYEVPTCSLNACTTLTVGVCPSCSYCGDGRFDAFLGEECDDGNGNHSDSCTGDCRFAICGDGIRQPLGRNGVGGGGDDEQCDDGNTNDRDGCSATCQNEILCTGGGPNGVRTGDEECDDGNSVQTDTCDNFCRLTVCGDGTVQSPNGRGQIEQCDDGNTLAADLCSPTCLTVPTRCGDGILDYAEECDDGRRCTLTGEPCQFDPDCPGAGNRCRGSNIDGCTTGSGCVLEQAPESTCNDSLDNDCDNLVDCADTANCPTGRSCGTNGRQCLLGLCGCPGGQVSETTCNDGLDNDCDGYIDCADPTDCSSNTSCAIVVNGNCDDIPSNCPVCNPISADTWTLSVSGVTPTNSCGVYGGGGGSGSCSDYNGTYTLRYNYADTSYDSCRSFNANQCVWCWDTGSSPENACGTAQGKDEWLLKLSLDGQWLYLEGGEIVRYKLPASTWKDLCTSPVTLDFDWKDTLSGCTDWPATLTVNPIGFRECDFLAGHCTETSEITCNDGIDNDCDGYIDCADPTDCSSNASCTIVGNCASIPSNCPVCNPISADTWTLSVSGVTPTNSCGVYGGGGGSGSCSDYNGTYTLRYNYADPSYASCRSFNANQCVWCWDTGSSPENACGTTQGKDEWLLKLSLDGQWLYLEGGEIVRYKLPASTWKDLCTSPVTLDFDWKDTLSGCTDWPATLTVNPIGFRGCDFQPG